MAILHSVWRTRRHIQIHRTEAPFIIIRRTVHGAFTKLQGKTHRNRFGFRLIMDFHLQGLIRREILRIRFEQSRHTHFLARAHIVVIQYESRFLERGIGICIAFRHRIRRFVIRLCIFTVVDGRDLEISRIANRFRNMIFGTVHFDNLRILVCRRAIEIGNRSFFPSIAHNAKANHLHLRFGHTRI